jgi:exodeoxyribonuclease V alpha subunit
MLTRNLLYTGVTRGKQLVVLIGQPKACALAVRNVRAMRRLTTLAVRLRHGQGAVQG